MLFYSKCHQEKSIFYFILTGINFGILIGVKFCGVFTVAFLVLITGKYFMKIIFDRLKSLSHILREIIKYTWFLILLPFCTYLIFFYIHLSVLTKQGEGANFYSIPFQISIIGNPFREVELSEKLASGSIVSIKGSRLDSFFLHSHSEMYPDDHPPTQQQVTGYPYPDQNNLWLIKNLNTPNDVDPNMVEYISDGDMILLTHIATLRNLHSHNEKAPISIKMSQVSCYGYNGTGDLNDVWIIKKIDSSQNKQIFTLRTKFKLVHALTGCELMESGEILPHWGYFQKEMICNTHHGHPYNTWVIITNHHPMVMKKKGYELVQMSFFEKFIESHQRMLEMNNKMVPKFYELTSKPWHWIINYKGMHISVSSNHRVYMLGNPFLYWSILIIFPLYIVLLCYYILLKANRIKSNQDIYQITINTIESANLFMIGWLFHYVPYFFMNRVLYFHHYMPAYLFYSMLAGTVINGYFDILGIVASPSRKMRACVQNILMGILTSFLLFRYFFLS
ncbi:hypothetical protein HZS_4381, partial [Henneguya salminicola]